MQIREYLIIDQFENEFWLYSSNGAYFTEDEYKTLDPTGELNTRLQRQGWTTGMRHEEFLQVLLNKLGSLGWDAVGNINAGNDSSGRSILLKRP
jgi:hypothetical protein